MATLNIISQINNIVLVPDSMTFYLSSDIYFFASHFHYAISMNSVVLYVLIYTCRTILGSTCVNVLYIIVLLI